MVTASLRKSFKGLWARLRKEHFAAGDLSCEICQAVETKSSLIQGHEVYSFPNPRTVQLEGIQFLCTRCHDVIHFERSRRWCQAPYLRTLAEHYCSVNGGISQAEFQQDITDTSNKMLGIRKFYGGPNARPSLEYGPYQDRADQSSKRKAKWLEDEEADWLEDWDDDGFEMFPDHECPEDIAMLRQ